MYPGVKREAERRVVGSGPALDAGSSGGAAVACPGGMSIEEYADRIAEEMHRRVDLQRAIIGRLLAEGPGSGAACPLVDCARLSRLQAALHETIGVIEETRSSFKSKRLEVLRKKLIDILAGV
jgi:hypothetical protein